MKKIAIHSVPRSGSTWLGSILDSSPHVVYKYQPLFSYAYKNAIDENSDKERIDEFFNQIYQSNDAFINQIEAKEHNLVPSFHKDRVNAIAYKEVRYHHILENMLRVNPEVKVIGLVRHPCAVINSWLNAPKEYRKDLGWPISEWRNAHLKNQGRKEEFNGYNKWKEVALNFIKLANIYPNSFRIVRYDKLLENTLDTVKALFEFLELDFTTQTLHYINSTNESNSDAYSVFKIKKQDVQWKSQLSKGIQDEILEDLNQYDSISNLFHN